MPGAPIRNMNAGGHGLYSARPRRHVAIPANPSLSELSLLADDLSQSALWIAGQLAVAADHYGIRSAARQIGLYASVAQELAQLTGELNGVNGIKASALGALGDAEYEALMRTQAAALELIVNQCISAAKYIQDREEILGEGGGLIMHFEDGVAINPTLTYLAGHMRTAKRILRELAANLAWRMHGADSDEDLSTRIFKGIDQ